MKSLNLFAKAAILSAGLMLLTAAVQAAPSVGTKWRLLDHPDAALADPSIPIQYGLRLDQLGGAAEDRTFSTELDSVKLVLHWQEADKAVISGTLRRNGNRVGDVWTVTYTLTGITDTGNGFTATNGSGTMTGPGSDSPITLTGYQKNGTGSAFDFLADGHRMPDSSTVVGRGWIVPANTDDWLVTAVQVPVPATIGLLGVGLIGLGAVVRRATSR